MSNSIAKEIAREAASTGQHKIKLTKAQKLLLLRDFIEGGFILCHDSADDRVARNLSRKGLGHFEDNKWRYSWRKRDGYFNTFRPNKLALSLIEAEPSA